jgi:DNA-binding transcriptional LysR family regulator
VRVVGYIESFDDRRGDGVLLSDEGERFYFHCVSIANGTRHIETGVRAHGERRVGHVGRDEISKVTEIKDD